MIQVSLADSNNASLFYETAELARGIHFEPFAEDENVGDVFLLDCIVLRAVIKGVF